MKKKIKTRENNNKITKVSTITIFNERDLLLQNLGGYITFRKRKKKTE